ncbi:MAG: HAMP domain-containing protein [Desulfobulbales bacterium]|nr:HAMP domain-containing protein [Desulfobulbales bacterium]
MKTRLIWKIFAINLLIIGLVVLIVWGAVDYLAADYFVTLMEKYHISPKESHQMFIDSIHRYLIWGSLAAIVFSSLVSFFVMKRILAPLDKMIQHTDRIAVGEFPDAIPVVTTDEIGQLALAFNRMTESLSHLEKLRRTMIVDVAHELKTPLTNIKGYLEGMMDEVVPTSKENFHLLREETTRLSHLVSDILKLARAGAAKVNLNILKVDFQDACMHVFSSFQLKFTEKNITVDFSGIEQGCRLYADPEKLAQVLHNLFENGLQYTPPENTMRVLTKTSGHETRVIFANPVRDLQEKDLPLLFERFYRGEKSRSRDYGGAGIGLAVVKELVEAHKGRVGARIANHEFQVWFTLPEKPLQQL